MNFRGAEKQPLKRFPNDVERGQQQQSRLDERGKVLDLAVAVLVVGVGTAQQAASASAELSALLRESVDGWRKLAADHPPAEHPVVRTHPETGEKVLNVCSFTTNFVNFHTPENVRFGLDKTPGASHLLNYLLSQASIPEYQVRFSWRPNSVAIWDNRSTQHYAVMDYWPAPRKMERAAIIGERPY